MPSIREQLHRSLKEGKVPHAHLFSGIEGVGKRKMALEFAKTLLDEKGQRVEKGLHPDCSLLSLSGKTIRVDLLRDLKQKAHLHPLEGKAKVFIIDPAEKMTVAGANALLKILEEPPAHTYLILITSALSQILPTIRSRCRILEFAPLSDEEILQELKALGKNETEAKTAAHYAQGSLKRALEFDPNFLKEIQEKLAELKKNPAPSKIVKMSEELAEEEEKFLSVLDTFSFLTYEKMGQVEGVELSRKIDLWFAIQKTKNQLDFYVNKRLLLETLLFKLATP